MMVEGPSLVDRITALMSGDELKLPVFSEVAMKLQRLIHSDQATIEEVERVIQSDQSLAAEVLRAANSSFFGGLTQTQTIRPALVRLGFSQVLQIVVLVTERAKYRMRSPLIAERAQELWWHSVATAMAAQWLARRMHHAKLAEEAFLGGLIHDIGKLAILTAFDRVLADKDTPAPSQALLQEIVETRHCSAGEVLLRAWKIPEVYVRVVAGHHSEAFDPNDTLLVLVRLGNLAARRIGLSLSPDPSMVLAATAEAAALGATEVTLAELEVILEDAIASLSAGP